MSSMENHKYGPTAEAKYKRKQIWPTETHAGTGAEMNDVGVTHNPGVDCGAALQVASASLKDEPHVVRLGISPSRPASETVAGERV
ncbi:hypothetical protein [Streptomyces sp. R08]|uniref:Uncharacterized protein n=1 Tax=Streptomyces sp. R08 TaxID=3238624 RepID=A0AB39M6Z8_9ACTN